MTLAAPALTAPVASHLLAVEERFAAELRSDLPAINQLVTHVSRFRGKMLRPTLVLLAGLAASESFTSSINHSALSTQHSALTSEHITLATVVEMVHMATLVHDDILDGAEIRRQGATINHLRGNEAAVLLGDYLISHAYHLCSSMADPVFARRVAATTNTVCEGELTQNLNRRNWRLTETAYYDIIYRKTAALTESCCRLGAMLSTHRQPWIEALAVYGKKVGLAFQIVDDLLDIVGVQKTVGKSLGTDIEKGKLTLPMIHFLQHAAPQHRELLIGLLESADHDRVERVRQLLAPSPSMDYARRAAERLVGEAVAALAVLPATEARESLTEAAGFITARDR